MTHILVIDVGTSSMRGILFDEDGRILHVLQRKYQVSFLSDTMAEQDPRDWEDALFAILRDHTAYLGKRASASAPWLSPPSAPPSCP